MHICRQGTRLTGGDSRRCAYQPASVTVLSKVGGHGSDLALLLCNCNSGKSGYQPDFAVWYGCVNLRNG